MSQTSFADKLKNYIKAGYPLLWIRTHEEARVTREIHKVVKLDDEAAAKLYEYYEWDSVNCLQGRSKEGCRTKVTAEAPLMKVIDVCSKLGREEQKVVVVLKDFHHFIDVPGQIRPLRNALEVLKAKGNMLIVVSPVIKIPVELEKEFQLLDYSLPNEEAIGEQLDFIKTSLERRHKDAPEKAALDPTVRQAAIEAAKGMTVSEVENAFSLAIIENKQFTPGFVTSVFEEKIQQVKKGGLLSYMKPDTDFNRVGGLAGLKKWIRVRAKAYSAAARDFKLPYPKGILLCGIPGCGKTLLAKATSKEFGFPLFQLDVGSLFGKHVGETEENFRKVIETVDGIGRCILFIDELEKALNRDAVSGKGDTGTSSRSFATLLSWLSDHTSPVFVIATSNQFTRLPTELVRKGRFDELFWIDLPTATERTEIFKVLLAKFERDPKKFKIPELVQKSDRFTGAEIENVIVEALFAAFNEGRELETVDLVDACVATKPLAETCGADLEEMRKNAEGKLRAVNETGEVRSYSTSEEGKRKLTIG